MVKIEMAPRVDNDPRNRSGITTDEYIWLQGQEWPVPDGEDGKVNRIEAFGGELEVMSQFPGGEILDDNKQVIKGILQWKVKSARFVSEQMRQKFPRTA